MPMLEIYAIYPLSSGTWSFSLLPTILLDNSVEEGVKNAEFIWLFWGFGITRRFN